MGTNYTPSALDDNLANGQTYTFQFKCANLFCLSDLSQIIQNDCTAQAPSFLTSLQVTSPPFTALYNVQFTYEGDNSDVVSDVAASIVAAVKAVSNDNITFIGAVAASASAVMVTPTQAASITAQTVTDAANTAIKDTGSIVKTATDQSSDIVNKALSGALSAVLPVLIVIVLIILFVLPSLATSVRKSGVTAI